MGQEDGGMPPEEVTEDDARWAAAIDLEIVLAEARRDGAIEALRGLIARVIVPRYGSAIAGVDGRRIIRQATHPQQQPSNEIGAEESGEDHGGE